MNPGKTRDRTAAPAADRRLTLAEHFRQVRKTSTDLAEPLEPEDMVVQSMDDASPTKWHLAHTTWFFETFVLEALKPRHTHFDPDFRVLFNSYYHKVGAQHPRPRRGILSRPALARVLAYRTAIDEQTLALIDTADDETFDRLEPLITIGLNHEQQHQELILTDIKHLLACSPLRPAYEHRAHDNARSPGDIRWISHPGGIVPIGAPSDPAAFAYDNEQPRHETLVHPFQLADRLATNAEMLAFIEDDAYANPALWLDDAWAVLSRRQWTSPLYWRRDGNTWLEFTLHGERPVDPAEPVTHISLYEADALARWLGARLPTEQEWEALAADEPVRGNFLDDNLFHPIAAPNDPDSSIHQLFGDCWEWTGSQYRPYPGFNPPPGALGEYNGKFMSNKFVLRGGACSTPRSHIRPTYRNFFPPEARWQFSGLRIAKDAA